MLYAIILKSKKLCLLLLWRVVINRENVTVSHTRKHLSYILQERVAKAINPSVLVSSYEL